MLCYLGLYARYCLRPGVVVVVGGSLVWLGGFIGPVHVFRQAQILTYQLDSRFRIPVWILSPQGTGELSSADHPWIGPHNADCDLTIYPPPYLQEGSFPFSAMNRFNWESMPRAPFPIITSIEITNGKKYFRWLWQCLMCLSFLIVYHLARSAVIGSYLYVSTSVSPSLTSIMASNWLSHKPRSITYPCVSLSLSLTWCISCSDMVRPWCIRGSARTYAEVIAHRDR